ncbi:hypothetical protein ACGYK4_13320 [Sulfitobacter sp. 1A13368]|uniref:hypothetical protein n=1 Tax=unclassified Sulfitobacter TaxID=196795 RepID=UPI003746387D
MQDDYIWVDRRWQEANWLDVFRMRLFGWLPSDLAAKAIENGLILPVSPGEHGKGTLTHKAHKLTDLTAGIGESQPNCLLLANVLIVKGFESSWLSDSGHACGMFLKEELVFSESFRDNILLELASLDRF